MPRKRRKPKRKRERGLTRRAAELLLTGHDFHTLLRDGLPLTEDALRALWTEYRDELVAHWRTPPGVPVAELGYTDPKGPGHRPKAWWKWDAPEQRRPAYWKRQFANQAAAAGYPYDHRGEVVNVRPVLELEEACLESTGETSEKAAIRFLNRRLAEGGRAIKRRQAEQTTYGDLEQLIRADYRKRQRRSTRRLETALTHLRAAFGGWKAHHITAAAWSSYQDDRLRQEASAASVNRERAALVRAFRLAAKSGLVLEVPDLDSLPEDNVRDVDVSPAELSRLLDHLPPHLAPLVTVAAITGWRRGELLSRTWADVDQESGFLWLDRATAKNREPRAFPLGVVPWLDDTLAIQYQHRRRIERETGRIISALFIYLDGSRAGEPIKMFRRSWATACNDSGLPGLRFHDLRRGAAVQMLEAGIPEPHAMALLGHKTASIFRRYAISGRDVVRSQASKLADVYGAAPEPDRKVVNLEGRT